MERLYAGDGTTHVQFHCAPSDQAAKLSVQFLEIKMHVQQFTRQFLEVKACEKVQQHSLAADLCRHCNLAVGREIFVPLFPGNLQLYIVGVSRLCRHFLAFLYASSSRCMGLKL